MPDALASQWCVRSSAATVGALAALLGCLALLLDIALLGRPLLRLQLERHWWGHADEGCWLAQRLCIPGRGNVGSVNSAAVTVWTEEGRGEEAFPLTERQCFERAERYWMECLDHVRGFVVVSFRRSGRTLTMPASCASDPALHAQVSVTLKGSVGLLNPGGVAWDLEACDASACGQIRVSELCNGDDSHLTDERATPLHSGCRAVREGTWPQCPPGALVSSCQTDDRDAAALRNACDQLCPLAGHAQRFFCLAVAATATNLFIVAWSLRYQWCRHAGSTVAVIALVGAGAAAASPSLLSITDAGGALAAATSLREDPHSAGWQPCTGTVEIAAGSVALAASAFLSIGASKGQSLLRYRIEQDYERFNTTSNAGSDPKQQRSEEPPLSRSAFEVHGDEARLGMADGVLIRSAICGPTSSLTQLAANNCDSGTADIAVSKDGSPLPAFSSLSGTARSGGDRWTERWQRRRSSPVQYGKSQSYDTVMPVCFVGHDGSSDESPLD